MTDTSRLIDQLAARAAPVRPLASPLRRTLAWLAMATLVIVALLAVRGGLEPGALHSTAARLQWAASLLTAVLAAYATFQVSVPGRSPAWAWLPLPALLAWLSTLGWGCLQEHARVGAGAFEMNMGTVECAWAITMVSVPLALVMLLVVRHAGAVRPARTALLATLGTAALSSAGVSLIHDAGESMAMVLLWHAGAVGLLSLASLLAGRRLLGWIGYARQPR
ncbi:NrsF family protein [Marilutibacter aestuarii]|uniref:DUF1109 domain-containing protein n=1 Tax=Marilutibacter aestuarii TaxID=1706195 RepID=A0A508AQ77_9GAMM|nr:NrsF family protein [Lysobacter aestuarii]TQD50634.1 DUF1109 domain-containing protein [Lysobacter aestuarii]